MRSLRFAPLVLLALAVTACTDEQAEPLAVEVPVMFSQSGNESHNFNTHMTGAEEVPARETRAQGQAIFKLSKNGQSLSYKLIVANIQNVTMVHIHRAPAGANGPVVAWLYPSSPPAQLIPGRSQGVLAEGVITAADLVGPMASQSLDVLITELRAGNAYVNVHTAQYPPGEIRGQIRENGPSK
jgi:hypothetical protein